MHDTASSLRPTLVGVAMLVCASVCQIAGAQEPWPTQVPVLAPDPVLGNGKVWEYWVYNEDFAQRFANFDREEASKELSPGVLAIVFRTFKRPTYADLNLYHCSYEVYFDPLIKIPLSTTGRSGNPYPPGVAAGFHSLRPYRGEDAARLRDAKKVPYQVQSAPVILADGKIDGKYAWFGTNYFPDVLDGISVLALFTDFRCRAIAPKWPESHHWVSILGETAFDQGSRADAHSWGLSDRFKKWLHTGNFDPGPPAHAIRKGLVRVPNQLYANVLPKVALIKSMNECITSRTGIERRRESRENDAAVLAACEGIEKRGEVRTFDFNHIFIGRPHQGY